ncbi:hypothetical protein RYH80_11945 [Halobaculum sp. MBLA0147]|uniref:hypothetical protein n=1 Tax=Halobaculum sp. MBLA0147 TaxID=3079934 RepID=UPI003525F642
MTDEFLVAVKRSAVERNPAVAAAVGGEPATLSYESRAAATAAAREFAADGGPVRLQQVAPQDDTAADAYLVGAARYDDSPPELPAAAGWTFGVGADEYGALGEALLTAGDGVSRPVRQFVAADLAPHEADGDDGPETGDESRSGTITRSETTTRGEGTAADEARRNRQRLAEQLDVTVDASPDPVTVPGESGAWHPDLRIDARHRGTLVATYDCEVKTGEGDVERNQRSVAERVADERNVVIARVLIDDLPETFEVSFHTLGTTPTLPGDGDPGDGSVLAASDQRTLGEW